ncbi:hypothetical protein [Pantoea sp. Ae16]|uniref:hypothetical protein n=1 Tax=Pantoea sp. Ae16 TaxID=1890373 RepID=UPI0008FD0FAC|nr:hypothetical protein [Pantoea sp. Ae16]OIX90678.1 hypothetical protein BFS13_10920 [Pantoea sp. Ae16]
MIQGIHYLTDEDGNRISAVIPIALFEKLMAETEIDEAFEPVPYTSGSDDDTLILDEVVSLSHDRNCSLHAAWRLYRGIAPEEAAHELGLTIQELITLEEQPDPPANLREAMAVLYQCKSEQL